MKDKCPICGKVMKLRISYKNTGNRVAFVCSCGYSTENDRSGLRYRNVIDRYQTAKGCGYNDG